MIESDKNGGLWDMILDNPNENRSVTLSRHHPEIEVSLFQFIEWFNK